MTEEVTISIEEYAKLITEKHSYEIGFIITITILSCLIASLLVFTLFKVLSDEENTKKRRFEKKANYGSYNLF